jgi:putative salt-induced outer membrane protein YdiY
MLRAFQAILALSLMMVAVSAHAGVIVLKNGDRITGSIKKVWDQKVFIEPAYSDEFSVDMDQIESIESDKVFEFNRVGKPTRMAKFIGPDEDGNQLVELDGKQFSINLMNVEEVDEQEKFFDWSFSTDFNASLESGNTEKEEFAIRTDFFLKYGKQKHYFDVLWEDEEQDKVTTKDRERYNYNFNYDIGGLNSNWFAGGYGNYETDEIKGLEYRYSVVPTVGYTVWDKPKRGLDFQLGYGIQEEEIRGDDGSKEDDGGGLSLATMRFRWDFGKPDIEYYLKASYTKQSYGRRNSVSSIDTGFKFEITDLLYFNVSSLIDYESEPAEGAKHEDIQMLIGLGLEFDK